MLQDRLHSLELVSPLSDLLLDWFPFLVHSVAFDDNFFLKLIDLSIHDSCSNSFNSPYLNIVFVDLQSIRLKRCTFRMFAKSWYLWFDSSSFKLQIWRYYFFLMMSSICNFSSSMSFWNYLTLAENSLLSVEVKRLMKSNTSLFFWIILRSI